MSIKSRRSSSRRSLSHNVLMDDDSISANFETVDNCSYHGMDSRDDCNRTRMSALTLDSMDEHTSDRRSTPVSLRSQLFGCFVILLGISAVSAITLVIKLHPQITLTWFIIWQGLSIFHLQSSLLILTHTDRDALQVIKKNWIGIAIKVGVAFGHLPITFRIIHEMPFGDYSVIFTCGPSVLVAVLAFLLFGEKLSRIQIGLIVLSLIGVVLIIRPASLFGSSKTGEIYPYRLLATFLACAVVVCLTAQVLAIRKMGFQISPYLLSALVGFVRVFSGLIYQYTFSSDPLYNEYFCSYPLYTAMIVIVSGIISSCVAPFEVVALQRVKTAVYMSIVTSKVVLDYVIQLTFFPDESLSWMSVLGAVFVTITALDLSLNLDVRIMEWIGKRQANKEHEKSAENVSSTAAET